MSGNLSNTNIDRQGSLAWFEANAGKIVPFSVLQEPYFFLATKAKGIWMPSGWDYPLSIKQTLNSSYNDSELIDLEDGNWIYWYHKEDKSDYRNSGLIRAMGDGIPIGVLIQVSEKPDTRYWVVGLGRILKFDGEFFEVVRWRGEAFLDTLSYLPDGSQRMLAPEPFDPDNFDSSLEVREQVQVVRHGQGVFRAKLMTAYMNRCAFTGTPVPQALDAAHIHPYFGRATNAISNGLLLRADIHRLFDERLISVDTRTMTEIVSPELKGTAYEAFDGSRLWLPKDPKFMPSIKALDRHREQAGF
jgi:hypothetical protein